MPTKDIKEIIFSIFKAHPFKVMPRRKILLGIALLLGLSLLLYQSLLALQLYDSKATKLCLLSKEKLVTYQQKIIEDPHMLLSKIEEKWNTLKKLEKRFIPQREVGRFFEDLKGLISKTENYLVSLDIKPREGSGTYQKLPFSISVKGHYVDAILLMNKLEAYPRLIAIKDIKIQPKAEKSTEVTMSLEAESFVARD